MTSQLLAAFVANLPALAAALAAFIHARQANAKLTRARRAPYRSDQQASRPGNDNSSKERYEP